MLKIARKSIEKKTERLIGGRLRSVRGGGRRGQRKHGAAMARVARDIVPAVRELTVDIARHQDHLAGNFF
ncbi:MAG: hypothetical protein JWO80_2427 [Bryobacterales bacterium]|nr:hypothetical protein [Bryobacterales bacterium]